MIWKIAAVLIATTLLTRADAEADRILAAGVREFESAFHDWDGVRFSRATAEFHRAAQADARSSAARYWEGVSRFHRMLYLQNQAPSAQNTRMAGGEAESAIQALDAAVAIDPNHAESHALLGTLLGMKIDGSALRAIRYGPALSRHRDLAIQHGSSNPRVRYLSGAGLLHMADGPDEYREALDELRTAEKLFAKEAASPPASPAPRWGASSCQTFIGRALEKLGRREEAVAAYRKALVLHPADHIAQAALKRLGAAS